MSNPLPSRRFRRFRRFRQGSLAASSALALTTAASLPLPALCDESPSPSPQWPQWRGPDGTSVAGPGDYPADLSSDDHLLWKAALPGVGSSTPAVWGDRIFVTAGIEGEDGVIAYDWRGEMLWLQTLGPERPGKHRNGSGSNPSPITDGERVVVYYKSGTVASLSLEGEIQWQVNLQEMYGEDTLWWDLGTSPVFAGGHIVVAVMQEDDSYVVALDPADGSTVWKVERNYPVEAETGQAYTTPFVAEIDGREQIVIWGSDHLTGHDPADGSVIWTCGGFNPENKAMWRVIASPGFVDDIAVIPYGRKEFLAGVRLGGSGDVTASARLWEREGIGADCPSPVGRDGIVYLLTDRGEIHCIDAATGEDLWDDAIPRASASYYASPALVGDLLYCAREDGAVAVLRVGRDGMELLSLAELDELIAAAPVPVDGKLLVRGVEHLYCFGK